MYPRSGPAFAANASNLRRLMANLDGRPNRAQPANDDDNSDDSHALRRTSTRGTVPYRRFTNQDESSSNRSSFDSDEEFTQRIASSSSTNISLPKELPR